MLASLIPHIMALPQQQPKTLLNTDKPSSSGRYPVSLTDAFLSSSQFEPPATSRSRRRSSASRSSGSSTRPTIAQPSVGSRRRNSVKSNNSVAADSAGPSSSRGDKPAAIPAISEDNDVFYDLDDTDAAPSAQLQSQKPACAATSATAGVAVGATAGAASRDDASSLHTLSSPQHLVSDRTKERSARIAKLKTTDVQQAPEELIEDIGVASNALHLFLNNRMVEANEIIAVHSDRRLYYALGTAILATIKAIMTFEHQDLGTAIEYCKDTIHIASLLRKQSSAIMSFGNFVRGTGPSVNRIASMDFIQRHAELIYAECTLLKSVLAIAHSGDIFGFLSEALHLRSCYGMYRSFDKYLKWAKAQPNGGDVDAHFSSGVYLGNGIMLLILGLLPSRLLRIMEVFGYEGDVELGLKTLSLAGNWNSPSGPTSIKDEGVRRAICDMTLLCYHLVISSFIPVPRVDIDFAEKVLDFHLQRYPHGMFFLYFEGRLESTQACSEDAIECFVESRDSQEEYIQLKHICYWDISLCAMSLLDWKLSYDCHTVLAKENNWSKAVYTYARAAALYQLGGDGDHDEARRIMARVPKLRQKIAGKSIPLEKYVARKATRMEEQGRMLLPGFELAYVLHAFSYAPRYILHEKALPTVDRTIASFDSSTSVDDQCLAHFLRGVILRNMIYPEKHNKLRPKTCPIPTAEGARMAEESLKFVADNGHRLEYDNYLLYFSHYELGRLYIDMGRSSEARSELELVLSGKNLGDVNRKGKYSMQNMALLRSNGALELIK